MNKIRIVVENKEVALENNKTHILSDVITSLGIPLNMPCGATKKCGKCTVKIIKNCQAPTVSDLECINDTLLTESVRLACVTEVVDGMVITDISKEEHEGFVVLKGDDEIEIKEHKYKKYGVALDIGTTTLALKLFSDKKLLQTTGRKNPQRVFGADVISRIEEALKGNLNQIQEILVNTINEMIQDVSQNANINKEEIDYCVFTGNTTMLYLLTGKNPITLSKAPFEADCLFGHEISASDIGINISSNAKIYLPRCMEAFVGADITTAILAANMVNNNEKNLIVDIGTNGEVALSNQGEIYCCSTAAGPAFEGAELSMGMSGTTGAIDKVFLNNEKIDFSVIGNTTPQGICGSGVVDILNVLLKTGCMDETGYLDDDKLKEYGIYAEIEENPAAILNGVTFTQKDVRQVQLAKSSIAAGILTAITKSGLEINDIDNFYIAGGFGNFINLESAVNIGLIPSDLYKVSKVIGNAAHDGAAEILCDLHSYNQIKNSIENATGLDLSTCSVFMDYYIDCMEFSKA